MDRFWMKRWNDSLDIAFAVWAVISLVSLGAILHFKLFETSWYWPVMTISVAGMFAYMVAKISLVVVNANRWKTVQTCAGYMYQEGRKDPSIRRAIFYSSNAPGLRKDYPFNLKWVKGESQEFDRKDVVFHDEPIDEYISR